MCTVSLESLELTPDELARSREAIRQMAYENWLNAGRLAGDGLQYWLQAEQNWIENCYVPHRLRNDD